VTTTHRTTSEEETMAVAGALVGTLGPGVIVLLHGDLGSGKTAFVRGLAGGLGVDEEEVSSPTFTLVHEYRGGRLPLYHADLYRLPGGASIEDLGLDEVAEDGVLAIEWPERLARAIDGAIDVRLAIDSETARTITIARLDVAPTSGKG
jgi:tRNA threonylcarbamoyladenosine biosynthesis protein TsaE